MAYDRKKLAELNCPTPITWTNNVQKLFTPTDVAHMKQVTNNALDLSNYNSVVIWSSAILSEVSSGNMPPAGSGEPQWTTDMVNTFACWIQQGMKQ